MRCKLMFLLIQRHKHGVYLDVVEECPAGNSNGDRYCVSIEDMAKMKCSGTGTAHCINLTKGWIEHGVIEPTIDHGSFTTGRFMEPAISKAYDERGFPKQDAALGHNPKVAQVWNAQEERWESEDWTWDHNSDLPPPQSKVAHAPR